MAIRIFAFCTFLGSYLLRQVGPGEFSKLTSKGVWLSSHHILQNSPTISGLDIAFCHMGLFLGSTSVVFKASLRQSIWIRCSNLCQAPHQLLINAHYCLKCYLQTIYILFSASSSSSGIACQGRVSSTSTLMVKLRPNPLVQLSERYSPHPYSHGTWATLSPYGF